MRALLIVPLCLVAACSGGGGGGGEEKKAEEQAATIEAGQWETAFEVTSHRSTDKTDPAVKAVPGDRNVHPLCVAEAEKARPPAALFAGQGYDCSYKESYIRSGRINATMDCKRAGVSGNLMMSVDGSYKAESFEGTVKTTSYIAGAGDFESIRKMSGRKTAAACAAGEPGLEKSGKGAG